MRDRSTGFLKPIGETRGPNLILLVVAATAAKETQHSGESISLLSPIGRRWSDRRM